MATICNHKILQDSDTNPINSGSSNGKRKAQESQEEFNDVKRTKTDKPSPLGEEKENLSPPSTPKGLQHSTQSKVEAGHEKTPGRIGPVKRTSFDLKPDIKPFKGPPGKKIRKTAYEKEQEYTQFIRENEDHPFHELHICFDKGPNSSPTLEKAGFELDYKKVAEWMKPKRYNKSSMVKGMERRVERMKTEEQRMAELFFERGEAPDCPFKLSQGSNHWKDRVSKDLNVPWHKIGVEHFVEWDRRGFKKARKGEYENFIAGEKERMMNLLSGASLRK